MELYGIQQQLARQQMILEQEQDSLSGLNQLRQQKEKTVENVRQLYRNMQDQLKKERQQSEKYMIVLTAWSFLSCDYLHQHWTFVVMLRAQLQDCVTWMRPTLLSRMT